jgi:hypothetical protein
VRQSGETPRHRTQIGGEPYTWKPKRPISTETTSRPANVDYTPEVTDASITETPETPARQPPLPQSISPANLIKRHAKDPQNSLERAQEVAQQMARKKSLEMKLKEINENLSRMSADTEIASASPSLTMISRSFERSEGLAAWVLLEP